MEMLKVAKNGKNLIMGKFTYTSVEKKHLNGPNTITSNPIFATLFTYLRLHKIFLMSNGQTGAVPV
jgi:hypothetical protein